MMSPTPLFTKLEKALSTKIPLTLKKILIESSFDSEAAILGINTEIIQELESFVNQNKNILESTEYVEVLNTNSIFKFKPGHKSVLNLLPKCLRDYKNKIRAKKSPNSEHDEDKLKEVLIQKLLTFCAKISFELTFEKSLILGYHIDEKKQPKCKISCPICSKEYSCYYTTYWHASNFERHLKSHITYAEFIPVNPNETDSNESNFIHTYMDSEDMIEVLQDL